MRFIRSLARILIDATQQFCGQDAFVGHIGGDDFVFICDDAKADAISQNIIDAFDKISPELLQREGPRGRLYHGG